MSFCPVAQLDSLWSGELRGVVVEGRHVLLARLDGDVFAYRDRCLHLGRPLHDGTLAGPVLTCAAHAWQYDLRTGCGENPEGTRLERYAVRIDGGTILVDVDTVLAPERRVRA